MKNKPPMKNQALLVSTAVVVACTAVLLAAERPVTDPGSPIGTWQLTSFKDGSATEYTAPPKDERHIKMITATHFLWATYDDKKRVITASMGGRYTLQGGDYTETVEFVFPDSMGTYLDKKQTFKIKVDGDKLTQSGALSDGLKIDEVWRRVQ